MKNNFNYFYRFNIIDSVVYKANTIELFNLLKEKVLKKSLFHSYFNHFDSSFVFFNKRNNLFFIRTKDNKIIELKTSMSLKYFETEDHNLKNYIKIIFNNDYSDLTLLNVIANKNNIYIAVGYNVNNKMKIAIQKYSNDGMFISEELLDIHEDIINLQFIHSSKKKVTALLNTVENGWRVISIDN